MAREILELPKEANLREIEKAYRKKALEFHPDRKRGQRDEECRKEMVQVNKAYQKRNGSG
jgi:DnaJ-class molecular chaperone